MLKQLLVLLLLLGFAPLKAEEGDPPNKLKSTQIGQLNSTMQLQLNSALANLEQSLMASAAHTSGVDGMQDLQEQVSPAAEDDRQVAQKLMGYLDDNPEKVKALAELNFEDLTRLPIGLSAELSDASRVTLGILEAKFFPTYAEVTVFARIVFTLDNVTRDLFFGVDGIQFTRNGFVNGGGFRAVLLGDYIIPGEKWTIRLRGGSGKGDRDYDGSKTYVNFDCNTFQEASLSGDVIFPRSVLLPYDVATGKEKPDGRVIFALNEAKFTNESGTKGMIAGISVFGEDGGPFCVPGFTRFGFLLQEATYDASDWTNAEGMFFPQNYQGDKDVTWKGFYMRNFSIFLPKAFRSPEQDNPNQDVAAVNTSLESSNLNINNDQAGTSTCSQIVQATNVIIDRTGFTGNVNYINCGGKELSAEKWKYTVTGVSLGFVQNDFQTGSITGTVSTPMQEDNAPGGKIAFVGVINPGNNYTLDVVVLEDLVLELKSLRSTGIIIRGSAVKLEYIETETGGGRFYPSCNLSGQFTPSTKATGTKEEVEASEIGAEDATARFVGLRFLNFRFNTKEAPYVSVDDFEYQRNTANDEESKLAKFPVQVDHISKFNGVLNGNQPGQNDIWIDFGFSLALAKETISGSSDLIIKTTYNPDRGKLEFGGIAIRSIYVEASTTAFNLKGLVEIYECDVAKGFQGLIDIDMVKPFKTKVCASANFGYQKEEGFRYGYLDGYFGIDTPGGGIPTGLGDVTITGLGMGMYFNMKPDFYDKANPLDCSASNINCSNAPMMSYAANYAIPFGFKVMVGLSNVTESFDARATLDFSLSRQYGINAINLYGSGAFTSKLVDNIAGVFESVDGAFQHTMGTMVKDLDVDALQNFGDGNDDQQDCVDKANKLNEDKGYNVSEEGDIAFSIGFMLDIPTKTLHAQAEVYINKGKLRGIGSFGQVVDATLHVGPDDILGTDNYVFYIHAGKPIISNTGIDQRMGLAYGNNFQLSAYAMIGWGVPPFPAPPARLIAYLQLDPSEYIQTDASQAKIREGNAIAIGAAVSFDFEYRINRNWLVLAEADAGFDVLMANNTYCKPDGWLFRGQVYGYALAEAYKNDKLKQRASFGINLRGNGLKPLGAQGAVRIELKLAKFINLNFGVKVKAGDVCS
ncbi:hypothetical protein SAMN06298216_1714 [Spirosomataceae bacterium TFI 002]|nr:hypothetical protein SAMN06298216_1714 [Spirosomataceae bacterium TFI 002]